MQDRARRVLHAQRALADALNPTTPSPTPPSTDADHIGAWALHDQSLLKASFAGIRYRSSPSPLGPRLAHTLILADNTQRVLAVARWGPHDEHATQGHD